MCTPSSLRGMGLKVVGCGRQHERLWLGTVTASVVKQCKRFGHGAGLEKVQAAAGNIARFQLIFKLTSDVNDNYLHIHTMKGILVASRVNIPCVFLVAAKLAHPTT